MVLTKRKKPLCLLIYLFLTVPLFAENLGEAITNGKPYLDLRYRYEFVNQDGYDKNAHANTIRLRLGYTTGKFFGFDIHVDLEAVQILGADNFNSTDNGKTEYPVVADPEDTELNQAFLRYTGISDTVFKLGRQRIKLDNDRFIGNVGWRQNEQTFDAFRVHNTSIPNTTLTFVYLANVNRIFGEHHSTRANIDLEAPVFHLNYKFSFGGLSAYAYLFDNKDTPNASHQNYGLRFTGDYSVSPVVDLLYTLELTKQDKYKDGVDTIDVSYSLLELGCLWKGFTVKLGYERLGGNGDYGFQTPFATLHAFNGWTDRFLATPKDGLVDGYLALSYKLSISERPLTLRAIYHDFGSDKNSIDYGTEWNLLALTTLWTNFDVLLKYANYKAKDWASDTTKFWTAIQYRF